MHLDNALLCASEWAMHYSHCTEKDAFCMTVSVYFFFTGTGIQSTGATSNDLNQGKCFDITPVTHLCDEMGVALLHYFMTKCYYFVLAPN